jgi:hypothetical protein
MELGENRKRKERRETYALQAFRTGFHGANRFSE